MDGLRASIRCAAVVGILCLSVCAGCRLTPMPPLTACPLPSTEQVERVLEIAPLGTPRAETVKLLEEAGVQGTFGSNESIYYCDLWKQEDESRWHINVQLLFDEKGELYATRPDRTGRTVGLDGTASDDRQPGGYIAPPDGDPSGKDPFQG